MNRQGQLQQSVKWLASATASTVLAMTVFTAVANAQDSTASEPGAEPAADAAATADDQENQQDATAEDTQVNDPSEIAPGTRLILGGEVQGTYTDNYYYQPSNQDKRDAVGVLLRPNVGYNSASPRFRFSSGVNAEIAFFSLPGSVDDYRDLGAHAGISWAVAPHHRLGYNLGVAQGHDPFGLGRTEGGGSQNDSLDRWVSETYAITYVYGRPRFAIDGKLGVTSKNYHTNRKDTKFLDHDIESGELTLFYHYSPKTSALLDLVVARDNFAREFGGNFVPRDAMEYRVRTGARWLATAKTSGDVRVGYATRHFDAATFGTPSKPLRNTSRFDWVINLDWLPMIPTRLGLQTGRQSLESYNEAGFLDTVYTRLTWKQAWTTRLSSTVGAGYTRADFVNTGRRDSGFNVTADAEYIILPKLSAFGGYGRDHRGSNRNDVVYDKNTVFLGLRAHY